MSTKTKPAIEPKVSSQKKASPKKASPANAAEKSGSVKPEKPVAAAKTPDPVSKAAPAKADKTAKQKPATVTPEPKKSVAKPVAKPAAKPVAKPIKKEKDDIVDVPVEDQATAPQGQKWQEIRLILEKLKEDTIREIRKSVKIGTEAVAAIEPGGDIYDQASSERDRELGLLLGDREREKIHSIDEALLRIDEGDYGICEECDEGIPLGRLKAMPFTRHCVKCKSDLEKLQAQTKRVEEERAYREIPLGSEEEE